MNLGGLQADLKGGVSWGQSPPQQKTVVFLGLLTEAEREREQAFPYQEFGCHIYENTAPTDLLRKVRAHPEPACIDWFHKVLPEHMF